MSENPPPPSSAPAPPAPTSELDSAGESPPNGAAEPANERSRAAAFRAALHNYRVRRRGQKSRRSVLRRRLTRTGIAIVALIVVIVGAVAGYVIYRFAQINRIHLNSGIEAPGVLHQPENILLIGSTNRCAATSIPVFRKECAAGVNGVNSDVVMIVHIVPKTHQLSLLSIPRDAFVPNARSGGLYNKIDAALADGPGQLIEAISQDFGIPINHFVDLNFGTFTNIVNILGGVKMYFPDRLYDAENPPLSITHTGCQLLKGTEALALVRSRHVYYFTKGQKINYAAINAATASGAYYTSDSGGSYDGSGDLGRIIRVHEFLRVVASAVQKRGLGDPLTDNALIGAIAPDLTVDSALGDREMVDLAIAVKDASFSHAPQYTLPIVVDAATYYYKGYNYGDVIFPSAPQDQQTIDEFLGIKPTWDSISPTSISVSVIDGTNSASSTASIASQLHGLGYKIDPTTATNYVGPVSETTVVYAKGHLNQARRVLSSLSGTAVMAESPPAAGADVSVITGSDLSVDHVTTKALVTTKDSSVASPKPSAQGNSGATTTTNPNFSAPTSATTALTRWDPRACPSS
ncbi:MAG: LCP family protein [Acidimicrobiales bacterium]